MFLKRKWGFAPSGVGGWCDGIDYNGFPTGINVINNKKKNKIIPIINIRGFLFLPSKVIYP
jgi:hypothetical protein